MNEVIEYRLNKASEAESVEHLSRCDILFIPPLSARVVIQEYARKIVTHATRFEAWSGGILIGLIAAYCNDYDKRVAYITNVSVLRDWNGRGIAARLMRHCIDHITSLGMLRISLQVAWDNISAIKLYEGVGFVPEQISIPYTTMNLDLEPRIQDEQHS